MAYRMGKLTGKDQSKIQRWSLGYFHFMQKREQADREFELKKLLHFILRGTNARLYELAYPTDEVDDPDVIPGHSYGVDDLEDLEKLLTRIDQISTKTQAELSTWTDWE